MPIIRNTEIRFHRPEVLKPIFKKPKDQAAPEDAGAGTSADAARSQQQARNWRYYLLKMVAIAPVDCATGAPPAASSFDQNSDRSSSAAGNRETDNSANNPGSILSEQENCRTIDRLRAGASTENIEHILKKGLERLDLLFTPQNLPERRKESEAAIDFYLENNPHQPVPPIVRDLLIVFDMAIRDVHRAFPYGRGNVLVRNRDALAVNAGKNPNGINVTESTSKNGLTELGRQLGHAIEPNSASTQADQIQVGLQFAASQLLLGSTSCSGYVDALAAASMARLSQIRLPDGGTLQLKVIGRGDGPIRLDDVELDHNICEATFTDKDGMAFPIILDPWADMNTPILKEHSKYQYGDEAVDCSYDDPTLPYQETMVKYMREASGNLQESLYNKFVELVLGEGDEAIQSADPDKDYPLTGTHEGFVTREPLNTVKEGVILPVREGTDVVTRRPSISSTQKNALFAGRN